MPGGQFTNLKAQARSLGLEERWHEVAQAYADANMMFGDIVKVTPSSKVVGDMALMMVARALRARRSRTRPSRWPSPDSVVDMLRATSASPPAAGPEGSSRKVLKGEAPITDRPAPTCRP
jgi:pyruvate carboxylase